MWSDTTRAIHARNELALPTDFTDAEWAVLEPLLRPTSHVGRPRKWPMRRIVEMDDGDIAVRIAGKWRIVETAAWDKQHLDLCGHAFIEIDPQGRGEMAFGALEASLDCGFTSTGVDFEWNGADEGDQVYGDG